MMNGILSSALARLQFQGLQVVIQELLFGKDSWAANDGNGGFEGKPSIHYQHVRRLMECGYQIPELAFAMSWLQ